MSVSLLPLEIGAHMGPGGSMMAHSYVPLGGFVILLPLLVLVALFVLLRRADLNGTPLFGTREGWGWGPGPRPHPAGPVRTATAAGPAPRTRRCVR